MSDLGETLRSGLLALGFDAVRFTSLDGDEAPGAAAFRAWLDAGNHGGMEWLARNADRRCAPEKVLSGAKSMVLLGVNYSPAVLPDAEAKVARYALYEDYHDTLIISLKAAGKLLEHCCGIGEGDHRYYVDTGPVLERGWAARSGLGFIGKNAMLISRDFGNWLFLAAILTRAELPADPPLGPLLQGKENRVGLHCGSCTRCLEHCPTKALTAPGLLDARRCISYLTIENKGAIPIEFRAAIGTRIYGCDVCAEICPWNRFAQTSKELLLNKRPEMANLTLSQLLSLTTEDFSVLFRHTPIKRIKLVSLLRNACIASGNSRDLSLIPLLKKLSKSENMMIQEHALWALAKLSDGNA